MKDRTIDVYDFFGYKVPSKDAKDKDYRIYKVRTTEWTLKQWIGGHLEYIKDIKTKDVSFMNRMNKLIKVMREG